MFVVICEATSTSIACLTLLVFSAVAEDNNRIVETWLEQGELDEPPTELCAHSATQRAASFVADFLHTGSPEAHLD